MSNEMNNNEPNNNKPNYHDDHSPLAPLGYLILLCIPFILVILLFKSCSSDTYSSNSSSSYSSNDREGEAWVCAMKVVEDNLKSPSSADFCKMYEATITDLGDDEYMITGYVDAENSFGATIRNDFIVTLTLTDFGFENAYCEFFE